MPCLKEIETLKSYVSTIGPYPNGVIQIRKPIEGRAFFPGGDGLWSDDNDRVWPLGKVMVLGHNFDSESSYEASISAGHEPMKSPTWSNLIGVLNSVPIKPQDCFFTNF